MSANCLYEEERNSVIKRIRFVIKRTKCLHRLTASDIPRGIDSDDLIIPCEQDPECPIKKPTKSDRFNK